MALAGLALLASFSPAVLFAQGLIPRNQGMASGIILGFAIGIGGLGISITGAIADAYGIGAGTYSLIALPVSASCSHCCCLARPERPEGRSTDKLLCPYACASCPYFFIVRL